MNEITEEHFMLNASFNGNMQVLRHHLYEYQKGLRHLILHTASVYLEDEIIGLLEKKGVSYLIRQASEQKINVFFGDKRCINVLREIGNKNLSNYTEEEDFILGIMLGYDRLKQCDRYLKRKVTIQPQYCTNSIPLSL
ncbi:DUF2023 family protein [Methanolobus psychrotolerans]|uniref:DUF2023 family protein n=1 Tax=Methanolobus psychrotolerans TaxID=1874706 RepID=UPI001A91CDFA|nr:DUF2023 family protein [Methanolobus psychrotolerans]